MGRIIANPNFKISQKIDLIVDYTASYNLRFKQVHSIPRIGCRL